MSPDISREILGRNREEKTLNETNMVFFVAAEEFFVSMMLNLVLISKTQREIAEIERLIGIENEKGV